LVELKEVKMRLVHAAALTAAALLLASVASAQGLGDAAAREKEKRKTGAKPAKVFTESDLGPSSSAPAAPETTAAGDAAGAGAGADGKAADAKAKPKAESDAEKAAAEEKDKAQRDWTRRLEQARQEERAYREVVDKLQLELNDTGGLYSSGRAAKIAFLDETKQKVAETQGRVAALEDEGRRAGYR
jgi:hypothetical protein